MFWYIILKLLVSVPYEITLLSNSLLHVAYVRVVSVPYEITLLSNVFCLCSSALEVSVPYEITLLSNIFVCGAVIGLGFSTL